jgi:hypothetical protein
MGWERERNLNSLSPHGLKQSEGHAAPAVHDANCVPGFEMPPGLLGPTPLGATRSSPYMPQPPAVPEKPRR